MKQTFTITTISPTQFLWLGALTILAFKLAFAMTLDLYSDEIFYWQASTRPALAYSDLPFMTALLAGIGNLALGDSSIAIRSIFIFMGTAIPLLVFWVASPLMKRSRAIEAAALSMCLPLCAFLGLLAVPDVPLVFFGILMTGCLERATRLNSSGFWLATGAAAALGVSTHYRFALYLLAGLIYLSIFKDLRHYWRKPSLWMAAILVVIGLLPTLIFNLGNDLSGIDYHLLERHPWEFQAEGLLHPFKQALLVTPLLYTALIFTLVMLINDARNGDSQRGLFALVAVINLTVYLVLAPWADSTRTSIHWPLSGYLPLIIFLPESLRSLHHIVSHKYNKNMANRLLVLTLGMGFIGSITALVGIGSQTMQDHLRPIIGEGVLSNKMAGWGELSEHVQNLMSTEHLDNDTVIVTDNYYTGAQLELALGRHQAIYNIDQDKTIRDGRAVQYALWGNNADGLRQISNAQALFITEDNTLTVPDKIEVLNRACMHMAGLHYVGQLSLFDGEKAFSFYRGELLASQIQAICPQPSMGWIDQPAHNMKIVEDFSVSGWIINEGQGVDRVEVLINEVIVLSAEYGLPRQDVVDALNVRADPNSPNLGFTAVLRRADIPRGRVTIEVRTIGKSGEIQVFGKRVVEIL
jgi:4-amino-4-deoxy-L-arabinose transferase-like glycosyltransferase